MITAIYKGKESCELLKYSRYRHPKLPNGVELINTWVGMDGHRCFQLMKTEDGDLLKEWTSQLDDLFDFEVDHVTPMPSPAKNNC
jgi:hypothetical protein